VDPETGFNYDDTKRYIDSAKGLSAADKEKIFSGNAGRVYKRFAKRSISSRV
jgi:4-oxalmesaconate hydratase